MVAATIYADLAAWAVATLQATSAVTTLVVDGASGIVESGELEPQQVQAAQTKRRNIPPPAPGAPAVQSPVLAIVAQDLGEEERGGKRWTTVAVMLYDRGQGYSNIRAAREAVLAALINQPVRLPRWAGVVQVQYLERSGHMRFAESDLDFEQIIMGGPLVYAGSPDLYN